MDKYVITIDTGTTNTRAMLWDGNRTMLGQAGKPAGVRNTAIDGNNSALKQAVSSCIQELLGQQGITSDSLHCVVAGGMITSNVGLAEIPHLCAPAGARELADGMQAVELPDVCPTPIWFVPGVKNADGSSVTLENHEAMDIMRGEEVESIALLEHAPKGVPLLLALPGSHDKFVLADREGRLTGCLTTIAGELVSCITNDTILADAVGRQYVSAGTYDREMVLSGYQNAAKTGLGRACFSARILNQFVMQDKAKIANYVLGAVLQGDVAALLGTGALRLEKDAVAVVAGKSPILEALGDVLECEGCFSQVIRYSPEREKPLSAMGMLALAGMRGIL